MKFSGLFLLLFAIGCHAQNKMPQPDEFITSGNIGIDVYKFDGFKPWLEQNNDTLYIFNFWATWCKPCVAELPYFEQLNDSLKNKKAKLILVSIDSRKKAEESLLPFISSKKLRSHVVLLNDPDFDSWLPKVSEEWTGSIPATLMVKGGKKAFFEQSFEFEPLYFQVNQLLNK